MAKTRPVLVILFFAAGLFGCTVDPFGPTESRPVIPIPKRYEDAVPMVSELLVVAEAPARSFSPLVEAAYSAAGTNLNVPAGSRAALISDGAVVEAPTIGSVATQPLEEGEVRFQLIRYWRRLGDAESYAGGTTTTKSRSVTKGASQTSTQTFSETLSIEVESEAGGLFASAGVKASASFTATQQFSQTVSTETTEEQSFSVSPRSGTNLRFSVWQLVEEFRYVGADGELFNPQGYDFTESSLRFIYPTEDVVPVSAYYES